jgi:BirA family biotin operon repressor/biotin-[acetyl-CoA-carboxylase] ligase
MTPDPAPPAALLSADLIRRHLGERAPSFDLQVVDQCPSTNTVLMAAAPLEGVMPVLVAERQTAGRGRRGRTWLAWPGASLTFSVLWPIPSRTSAPAGLSLVAGLALAVALEKLGYPAPQLKWPNDVLMDGRKVAGILVELQSARGRPSAAVIGVGVNVALPPGVLIPDQPAVTSLAESLGTLPDRNRLLAAILAELQDFLEIYGVAGFGALRGAWGQRNRYAGMPVRILGEGVVTEGTCEGVDEDGALLLRTGGGVRRILSGEVSLRGLP